MSVIPQQTPQDVPFDQYQRYRITAEIARAMGREARAPRVLDVGGHHSDFWGRPRRPIAEFLPGATTWTLDIGPNPLPGYVRGRGDALPFKDASVDLVCSVDVLEHVPQEARTQLVRELQRTAARAIVLAAPFRHPDVERAEALVSRFIRETCGYEQGQLLEHRAYGLPDLPSTWTALAADGWTVRAFAYGNLWHWALMMIDKHAVSALAGSRRLQSQLDRAYNDTHFALDAEEPCYRHFLVATRRADDPLIAFVDAHFGARASADAFATTRASEDSDRVFGLLDVHAANQHLQARLEPQRRDDQVSELETLRAELYKNLNALTAENKRLEQLLRDVEQSPTYRLSAWFRRWLPSQR